MTNPWRKDANIEAFRSAQQKAVIEIDQRRGTFGDSEVAERLAFEWLAVAQSLVADFMSRTDYGPGNSTAEPAFRGGPDRLTAWLAGILTVSNDDLQLHTEQGLNLVFDQATHLIEGGWDSVDSPGHFAALRGRAEGVRQAMAPWDPIDAAARTVRARELEERQEAQRAVEEALAAREQALSAQEALKAAYSALARTEARTADIFRLAVLGTLAMTGVGAAVAARQLASSTGIAEVITHLAFTIPAFVLAGYFARESAQHRKMARWASVLAVQLSTIRNYIGPLDKDQQNELQTYFGKRVLGDLPGDFGGKDEDLTTALSALEKLAGELSARRS